MSTLRLKIEYDGTRYSGWQEQKNARTVAGEIRGAAEKFLGAPVDLSGAGRTDAGVHALAQVARLDSRKPVRASDLYRALNDLLPTDISILSVEEAGREFDPRRDALSRFYLYQISRRRTAFAKRFVWWVKDRLDVERMRKASDMLAGRHDYWRFCDKRAGERSTVVEVTLAEMAVCGDLLLFRVGASHFLWKMVRRIVGTLVEVGRGSVSVKEFASLVDCGPAQASGSGFDVAAHTAPPSGLFLERVVYEESDMPNALAPAFPVR